MSQITKQLRSQSNWFYSLWKFSRPHTIIGTTLSVLGIYLIVISLLPDSELKLGVFFGTWISCLLGNIYIVGLNQLEDVAIDRINKPHLPLASGELSLRTGRIIVTSTGILSLLLAWYLSPFLLGMVSISLAIGTAYSSPPIRLKRYPFLAALCIFSVRGTIVNLGLFLHFSWVFKQSQIIPPPVWALTWFILVFTFAIAIFKDIPDVDGDLEYNITTFTIQLGKETVFNLARWVLSVSYVGIILVGFLDLEFVNSSFLMFSHLTALILMWFKSRDLDLQDKIDTTSYYQFIWKLFFVEYLIFPFACLLA
ncbi:homogentisate phytyltransferase [Mastigocoleus testarum]|uniref:Tocopherol phytyltransferase n=1 Tax=Mastigocoleus testarum BC008 TaxID=371196 RepID=A0A0V7ZFA4_9CYAN|nr:homogentisate phytyltransferase [Mastigocoleus testarum]KST62834.1 tocopherol phytyltransferase [Mastigocoleus testarum BC008]KST62886.1 tocopherol phytyltransferase [Mastigocoleus testarum BC008]